MNHNPWLAALAAFLVGSWQDSPKDPAAAFAADLMSARDWSFAPLPLGCQAGQEYCDAKEACLDPSSDPAVLRIMPLGKGSHVCDGPTDVSKALTLPGSLRLAFTITTSKFSMNRRTDTQIRIMDPEGRTTYHSRPVHTPFSWDLDNPERRELLILAPEGTRVRLVLQTTCRTVIQIREVSATSYVAEVLKDADREAILGLVAALRSDDLARRDDASDSLKAWLRKAGFEAAVIDLLVSERGKSEDPEVRSRIDLAIYGAGNHADLRRQDQRPM